MKNDTRAGRERRARARFNGPNGSFGADPRSAGRERDGGPTPAGPQFGPADLLPFAQAFARRWPWLVLGAAALGWAGGWCGVQRWKETYTASTALLRQSSTHVQDVLGDHDLDPNTYASLLRAPELVERVAAQALPPVDAEWLAARLDIVCDRNSDVLQIAISTTNREAAVDLANRYSREAVKFTQELQTNTAARARLFVTRQLAPLEAELTALHRENLAQAPVAGHAAKRGAAPRAAAPAMSPLLLDRLQAARQEAAEMLARYTEKHPLVQQQEAKIAVLQQELLQSSALSTASTNTNDQADAAAAPAPAMPSRESLLTDAKLQMVENARLTLLEQQEAARALELDPPGTCQILAPATLQTVIAHKRTAKIAVLAGFGGLLGFLLVGAVIVWGEAVDPRLKTVADVERVTRLPVVASAMDLAGMSPAERRDWAFRAWTNLQGLLSCSPNHGFVCGFTSSDHGEGRSTWVRLLADAASQRGFRVLTIVAVPGTHNLRKLAENQPAESREQRTTPGEAHTDLVMSNVLNTPDAVTQKLIGPNPEPIVQIPLPGWVWDLERRRQWHAALRHWSQIDNIALLIELAPASMPETVLLAENLPNLIWLADAKKATAAKTCDQLQTLRHARCHLAGAVLNRADPPFLRNRLARWFA